LRSVTKPTLALISPANVGWRRDRSRTRQSPWLLASGFHGQLDFYRDCSRARPPSPLRHL